MQSDNQRKLCFLFTKKYPFGNQEAYIHYEIDYLAQVFDFIYIIPIEEYGYQNERKIAAQNVQVFRINLHIDRLDFPTKLIWMVKNNGLLFKSTLFSREKIKSIKSHILYARRLIHMRAQGKALAKFLERLPDHQNLVCYHYWMHNSIVVQSLSGIRPQKTVSRAHALDLYHKDWPTNNPNSFLQFEKLKIEYCDQIFSISQHGLDHFNQYFSGYREKFKLSRLGIFDKNPEFSVQPLNEEIIIVTCSSLVERKRLYLMPDILSHMKRKVKWVHIGGHDSTESEFLKTECHKRGVDFEFKGQMTSEQILDYYHKNNIALFCNLSYAEGIPVSLMEAAMFGIPMLATRTFGNPEIVNAQNGILISVDFNPKEVAQGMDELFNHPLEWQEKSRCSRAVYESCYNADINFSSFIDQVKLG